MSDDLTVILSEAARGSPKRVKRVFGEPERSVVELRSSDAQHRDLCRQPLTI